MSQWVYSLCYNHRLTSITLSGKMVKPDIKAGSEFHPYCQFSRVIISLNAKSPACNWFNCILLQLPPMPSTAQPALGWQFLEHPQVSPTGRDQHSSQLQVILLAVPRLWLCHLGTENYLPVWPFLSPGQLRWDDFCSELLRICVIYTTKQAKPQVTQTLKEDSRKTTWSTTH